LEKEKKEKMDFDTNFRFDCGVVDLFVRFVSFCNSDSSTRISFFHFLSVGMQFVLVSFFSFSLFVFCITA